MVTEVPFRPRKMDSQEPHGGFADWVVRIDVVPRLRGLPQLAAARDGLEFFAAVLLQKKCSNPEELVVVGWRHPQPHD